MILNHKNGLHFFIFSKLAAFPEIRHGVFTRTKSDGRNSGNNFNVSLNVRDDEKRVIRNRALIAECMGGSEPVFTNQVHGTNIIIFDKNKPDKSPPPNDPSQPGNPALTGDAMVTNIEGKSIAIQQADCQAVLIYDPSKKVIANVHAGWRGNIQNIIGKCIESMQAAFDCDPHHLVASVSPSLGPCCSEFKNYKDEFPEKYWRYKDKYDHFNLWMISFDQLLSAGLQRKHIELSNICTKCNDHLFFSYRKTNQTGRFVSVIGLK
jgi:purine-nucleoside/S-methyl-5'-thioadenosine phosphorylase / adenosine deaminase